MSCEAETGKGRIVGPADVAAYYDSWTEKYVEAFGECIQAHRPTQDEHFLEYLMAQAGIRDGMLALDAGCGICGPARYFAQRRNVRIEAATISPVQAEIARTLNEAAGLESRIRVMVDDFHRLPEIFGREVFDLVYFLESLSHSPNPAQALAAAYDVLKPGGSIYIKDYFIRPCESQEEQQRVLEVVSRVDQMFATNTAWAEDVRRHLREAGFVPVFARKPDFEVDNSRWQLFEQKHQLDLFAGGASFDWSEWLEIKSQKP
jgi:SAM-dependent methyltransferase